MGLRSTLVPMVTVILAVSPPVFSHVRLPLKILHTQQHPVLSGLWPYPSQASASGNAGLDMQQNAFSFSGNAPPSILPRLERAFSRYTQIIFNQTCNPHSSNQGSAPLETLQHVRVTILTEDLPKPEIDESYTLEIGPKEGRIQSQTLSGALHGLEVFSQLCTCYITQDKVQSILINATMVNISDTPRFKHRGVMIDTARHYLPVAFIFRILDSISMCHINVLHWHITDQQSFPLKINATMRLSKGAWSEIDVYTADDIKNIVEYAYDRGIRVIPEIDMPSHSLSWGAGYENITLPECQTLNPASDVVWGVIEEMFKELGSLFPDEYFHIGCDEVNFACWNQSEPAINWMKQQGFPRTDLGLKAAVASFITRAQETLQQAANKTPIVWQEAVDHYGPSVENPTPPPTDLMSSTIVELWLDPVWNWANLSAIVSGDGYYGLPAWPKVTPFRAIVTNGWYLSGDMYADWQDVYSKEPLTNATCNYTTGNCSCTCPEGNWRDGKCYCYNIDDPLQVERVLGGEAPLWGEHIDEHNWMQNAYPNLLAVAERLWSPREMNDIDLAAPRLQIARCRYVSRGFQPSPFFPGACT
eukprot:m.342558 g.342558  ORF g.342558 m.342558 type:complete len:587 (-) comp21568_c0_seq1:99-1859(-)